MSLSSGNVKYRHELKYLISSAMLELLKKRTEGIMRLDPHVSESGKYTIRSLYFDDYNNRCFYENENGVDPREKYRIRIYNHSADRISLELKRKERTKTHKESAVIDINTANRLIKGQYLPVFSAGPPLLRRLCADMAQNLMRPVVIVEYERIPFVYKYGNVRVTFDTNLSSCGNTALFFEESIPKRPVLPEGLELLEVKFDEYLPDVICNALQIDNLQQTAFSKYYLCRKYTI